MRKALVFVNGEKAGVLTELELGKAYLFEYLEGYHGPEISRTMLIEGGKYSFDAFPPFFEGLLPEGNQLDGLLKIGKVDKNDMFSQLLAVGKDMVGAVTVEEILE